MFKKILDDMENQKMLDYMFDYLQKQVVSISNKDLDSLPEKQILHRTKKKETFVLSNTV